jgi:hemoglobin/transferrin/lactoferrin receptor protein
MYYVRFSLIKVLIGLAVMANSTLLHAQTLSIVDREMAPVPFATVQAQQGLSATADVDGRLELTPDWWGCDSITVRSLGFEPQKFPRPTGDFQVVLVANVLLDEARVTARRTGSQSAAPNAMNTMRAEQISRVMPANGAELLWSSGHVMVQRSQQGGGSPIIRGFEANRILLVVDGIRMNNAIYRSGHLQNSVTVDPLALEGVDVISGASSVLFGSDAMGGVVHYRTRRLRFQPGTEVRTMLSWATANNAPTLHADIGVGGEKWAYFTSITMRSFGDLKMGKWRPHGNEDWGRVPWHVGRIDGRDTVWANENLDVQPYTGYTQTDAVQKVRYGGPARHLELNAQVSTSTHVSRFDKMNDLTSDGLPRWAMWQYGPQNRTMLALHYRDHNLDMGRLHITAAVQSIEESRLIRLFGSDSMESQLEDVDVYSLQFDIDKELGKWALSYGGEWTHNAVTSSAEAYDVVTGDRSEILTRYPNEGSTTGSLSAYAAAQRKYEKWSLNAGLRYSRAQLDAQFSPQEGLDLPFSQIAYNRGALTGSTSVQRDMGVLAKRKLRMYGSIATAYRNPNVDDVGKVRAKGGYVLVPSADIAPEKLVSVEGGVNWGGLHVGAFHTWLHDAMVPVNTTLGGADGSNGTDSLFVEGEWNRIQTNSNALSAQVGGLVVDWRWAFEGGWAAMATLNITAGWSVIPTAINGFSICSPMGHIPPTFGRASIGRKYVKGLQWEVQLQGSAAKRIEDYASGSTDNPSEALESGTPAWWTASATVQAPMKEGFTLGFGLHNIADHHYKVFASGLSAAGRELRFTLRWSPA